MFSQVIWIVGFASAILALQITGTVELLDLRSRCVKDPGIVIGASALGILVCCYAVLLVRESREHIFDNWERAGNCKERIEGLDEVLAVASARPRSRSKYSPRQVWNQVFVVIAVFAFCFVALIVLANKLPCAAA